MWIENNTKLEVLFHMKNLVVVCGNINDISKMHDLPGINKIGFENDDLDDDAINTKIIDNVMTNTNANKQYSKTVELDTYVTTRWALYSR